MRKLTVRLNRKKGATCIMLYGVLTVLAGCASYNHDWPLLTGDLPDESGRDRVIERAAPAAYDSREVSRTENSTDLGALLVTTEQAIKSERLAYQESLDDFLAVTGEAKIDAWFDLQVALTRLSDTVSQLDPLTELTIDEKNAEMAAAQRAAIALKQEMDAFVKRARQNVIRLEPSTSESRGRASG